MSDKATEYLLMRKSDPVTIVDITEDGIMTHFSRKFLDENLAPLQSRLDPTWITKWWKMRSIPMTQNNLNNVLLKKGIIYPEEFLVKNLGLSLTDYYWIKPIDSSINWDAINFYDNDFEDDLLQISNKGSHNNKVNSTPNASLQGQLEKTWKIADDNSRILIKGNHGAYSAECINEIIASELHQLQGFSNYTPYHLIKIPNKPYEYGCYSKNFTSLSEELVSGYAVVTSEKKPNNISYYEHFINICGKHGIDKDELRESLEYQILTDFILTGTDRHLNNFGVLRDADTLRFTKMAPIYDSGSCLFCNIAMSALPKSRSDFFNIETTSFASTEKKLLKYVRNRNLVDVSKLPSPKFIRSLYEKDDQYSDKRLDTLIQAYEIKVDMFRDYQLGRDIYQRKICMSTNIKNNSNDDYNTDGGGHRGSRPMKH